MRLPGIVWICSTLVLSAQGGRLAEAVRSGLYTDALKLLERGADPNERDSRGNTPLMYAAAAGQIELAKALLDRQALLNDIHRDPEYNALHLAAANRQTAMVDYLLSQGASPNFASGPAPLPPEYRARLRKMAACIAAARQKSLLCPQGSLDRALWLAAGSGNLPLVEKLLASRARPVADSAGETALEAAAAGGHTEVVRVLVATGIRKELIARALARRPPVTGANRTDGLVVILRRLQKAAENQQSEDYARIARAANWYSKQISAQRWKAAYSEDYLLSLQWMADTLEKAPDPQTVSDIAEELDAKREYCIKNNVGMGGAVKVNVHTRTAQKEVPNWQVYYLLKIFERNQSAVPGAFLKWSSPASESIEPGRYWIWAKDPASNKVTERKLVPLNGAGTVAVDLFVP